jgi:hypothetical protein
MTMTETCDNCGLPLDDGSHFAVGKTWCRACWAGRKPAVAMPPSEAGKRQIQLWLAPHTSTPPRQQKPRHVELVKAGEVLRG